jgi:hypothetical protein
LIKSCVKYLIRVKNYSMPKFKQIATYMNLLYGLDEAGDVYVSVTYWSKDGKDYKSIKENDEKDTYILKRKWIELGQEGKFINKLIDG